VVWVIVLAVAMVLMAGDPDLGEPVSSQAAPTLRAPRKALVGKRGGRPDSFPSIAKKITLTKRNRLPEPLRRRR